MARAEVAMMSVVTTYVTVDIPDDTPEDERYEAAVEAASMLGTEQLCHQCCGGYGRHWHRDMGEGEVPDPDTAPYHLQASDIVIWLD